MAQRERRTGIWMTLVTILWIAFAIGLVVLILFAAGVLGPTGGNGDDGSDTVAVAEQNGEDNGEEESADQNGDESQTMFTSQQADRGQQVYSQSCAECHGGQLDGDPPLTGGTFAATWDGMPVHALYEVISQTMPQDDPGSLSPEEYADVTAHILAFNGLPDGDDELDPENSDTMEAVIRLDDDTDDATADEGDPDQQDDTMAEEPANGNGEENGDAEADANGDTTTVEAEEPAEGDEPGASEGWIEVNVEPASATVNIIGPGGYVGQITGGGTLTGLEPGAYIVTASLGNFSHRMDALVGARDTVTVDLRIDELAASADVSGAGNGNGEADSETEDGGGNGEQEGEDGPGANGEADPDDNGNDNDSNGNDSNGNDSGDENGDNGANGDSDSEGWYTEDQAASGADEYSASCASCHNEDGMGDPPLVDGALEASFDTVWDLFDYTSSEMPQDSPGSLDEETYVVIVAHMLEMNDYPAGDEELEADEQAMSEMSLDGSDNGAENGGNGEPDSEADGEANGEENGEAPDDTEVTEDDADAQDEQEATTAAARGASSYSASCAMCHGPTLEGITAPPLAGPVFMDRWGGHPVDWLYFQAHTSMPPDAPGSLDDQAYVDIIVHILTQNGLLEGDEQFIPNDPLLVNMIIGGPEQQSADLHSRIDALRRELHDPFEEDESGDPEDGGTQVEEVGVPELPDDPEPDENGEEEAAEEEEANGENGEDNGGAEEADDEEEEDAEEADDAAIDPEESEIPVEGEEGE